MEDELTTPTFTSRNPETGLIETRNTITGELISVQESIDQNILYAKEKKAQLVIVNGRELLVEAGVNVERHIPGRPVQWIYTKLAGETIAQLIAEGRTFKQVSAVPGIPSYAIIIKWRTEHPEFDEIIKKAFRFRAEFHRDRVIEIAEEDPIFYKEDGEPLTTKQGEVIMKDAGHRRIQVEAHKWAAGTDYSDRFGQKTKVEGEVNVKHRFIVDTGIRRPNDPGYNIDQTRVVQEREAKKIAEGVELVKEESKDS